MAADYASKIDEAAKKLIEAARVQKDVAARKSQLESESGKTGLAGAAGGIASAAPIGATIKGLMETVKGKLPGLEKFVGGQVQKATEDRQKTTAESVSDLVKKVPVVGGFLESMKDLGGVLDGSIRRIAKLKREHELFNSVLAVQQQYAGRIAGAQLAHASTSHEVAAYARMGPPPGMVTARETYGEQRAYDEERRRQGARDNIRHAEARQQAAKATANDPMLRLDDVDKRIAESKGRLELARGAYQSQVDFKNKWFTNLAGKAVASATASAAIGQVNKAQGLKGQVNFVAGSEEGYTQAIMAQERESAILKGLAAEREDTINQKKEKGLGLTAADSALRKGIIEQAKTELAIAEQREQKAVQQVQTLGQMTRMDFELGKQALKHLMQRGPEGVSPDMLARARQVGGEVVGKIVAPLGEKRRAELRDLGGDAANLYSDDLASSRKKTDALAQQVRELGHQDVTQTATAVQKVLKDFSDTISKALVEAIERARIDFDIKMQRHNRGLKS